MAGGESPVATDAAGVSTCVRVRVMVGARVMVRVRGYGEGGD